MQSGGIERFRASMIKNLYITACCDSVSRYVNFYHDKSTSPDRTSISSS